MDFLHTKSNVRNERQIRVGITGASTSDPTKRAGPGVTVTRDALGVYKYAFVTQDPGTFVEIGGHAFRADTASAVKGYTISAGVYTAPSGTTPGFIKVSCWDSSNNAVDLAVLQYLDITFVFADTAVIT